MVYLFMYIIHLLLSLSYFSQKGEKAEKTDKEKRMLLGGQGLSKATVLIYNQHSVIS